MASNANTSFVKRLLVSACMVFLILTLSGPGILAAKKVTLVHLNYYWHGEAWKKFLQDAAFVNATGRLTSLIPIQARLPKSWKVFIDAANHPNTMPGYVIPQSTEIDAFANPLTDRVFRGQISAREALTQIHRRVAEILKGKK